jgi:ribulose-phosphate 3-epimerase
MVSRPEDWIEPFAKAGANCITIHTEASTHLDRQLRRIRELNCLVGVSLNPATPLSSLEEVLGLVDLVLVMSVNPGFGGQSFIPETLEKIRRLKEVRETEGHSFLIEVDGGVSVKNSADLSTAGADILVAGTAIFGQKNRAKAISELRSAE